MNSYEEINGNLIKLAEEGKFEVIAHGCNCQCTMGAGIAVPMAKAFGCDKFPLEDKKHRGNINKLGTIDYELLHLPCDDGEEDENGELLPASNLYVVNLYSQYNYGTNHIDGTKNPIDYEALTLGLRKINHIFKGKHIGLPGFIGCGLAGGSPNIVREIIKKELKDCKITVVFLKK
jgi:O-acetyl-ADP-ribose deacetylase (regulator of RNase III)